MQANLEIHAQSIATILDWLILQIFILFSSLPSKQANFCQILQINAELHIISDHHLNRIASIIYLCLGL